ncbi:MAG: monovalent cation/H(+) antiporter subunit G [Actinomycetota bacterium]
MNLVTDLIMLAGALVALLAGVGVLRFSTPYARFHAAGKASPIALLLASIGAGWELGWVGSAYLATASAAMVLTLPLGVHLLFRAVYRTSENEHLAIDHIANPPSESGSGDA